MIIAVFPSAVHQRVRILSAVWRGQQEILTRLLEAEKAQKAKQLIYNMTRILKEGDVYVGRVTRIIPIGAFVEVLPGKEGMIHISQLAEGRVGKVEDAVAVGDEVVVKVREIDVKGRLNLTRLGIHPDEAMAARKEAAIL